MVGTSKKNHYILILCGGTGPRLWPLSRASNPKQFLSLFGKESLLEQTIIRAIKTVPASNVFLISNNKFSVKIKNISQKYLNSQNLIFEPEKKNTALAILYGTFIINKINPNALIATLPSDHLIKNLSGFKKTIDLAYKLAETQNSIITIGIKPDNPSQSYGYINPDQKIKKYFPVNSFIEKPNTDQAQKLIQKGSLWNSGIYIFSINTLINEFKIHENKYFKLYKLFSSQKNISDIYKISPSLAIDTAISEKSKNLILIPSKFNWSDVGEWRAVYINTNKDKQGHAKLNLDTQYLQTNSSNCLVSGSKNKMIGLVGVHNLAIIDTPDCLLICNLKDSYNVRDIVTKIVKNKNQEKYFLNQNDQ